jgi:toxin FitB
VILLDTNVVSEPLRPAPDHRVVAWIDAQPLETLFLSAITVAELRAGVALLPPGKRRASLLQSLETRVLPLFAGRMRRGAGKSLSRFKNWPFGAFFGLICSH